MQLIRANRKTGLALLAIVSLCSVCCANHNSGREALRIKLSRETSTSAQDRQISECLQAHTRTIESLNSTVYKLADGALADDEDLWADATGETTHKACQLALSVAPFVPFKGVIQIGEPPQEFKALFDTSTDVIWVPHSRCNQHGLPWDSANAKFASHKSETYKRIGKERVKLAHPILDADDMELNGWWVSDVIRMADARGKSSKPLAVAEQPIAMICYISGPEFPFRPLFEARVGLSFAVAPPSPSMADDKPRLSFRPSLLENMLEQKLLAEPVFSFHTNRMISSQEPQTAQLVLGQLDESLYTGPITWTPVTRGPLWEIRLHSVRLMGKDEKRDAPVNARMAACARGCEAVVDSGVDAIFGPDADIELLNEKLGFRRNHYNRDLFFQRGACVASVPRWNTWNLVLQVGDSYIELKPEAFVLEWTDRAGGKFCFSALRSHQPEGLNKPTNRWILGSSFISGFYTIFDYGQKRVGFATAIQ